MKSSIRTDKLTTAAMVAGLLIVGTNLVTAVPLVSYSFSGSTGSEVSFAPDAQPPGAVASSITRGSGLVADAGANAFNSSAWTMDATIDPNDYYAFSVAPESGQVLSLTRLELDERRSGTGIRQWAIYSSLDGFGQALAAFSVPDDTATRVDQGVDLGGAFSALTASVEFRVYGFVSEGSGGTWRIDNVELSGTADRLPVEVPDGGTTAMLLGVTLGGLGIVARRRRYQ